MKIRKNRFTLFIASLALLSSSLASGQGASKLTLADYLNQVKTGHAGYASSETAVEGAQLRAEEGELITRPSLLGSAQLSEDKRETGSPLQGDELKSTTYSLGLRQQTSFGLDARLLYNQVHVSMPGANPVFVPQSSFYTAGPVVELSQALGRNWLGAETKATKELLSSQVQASQYSESYKQKQFLAQAENGYWRLAIARESVAATKETVARAQKLKKWSSERNRLNLGNKSDYLQTEANYLARSLELQTALDEEKAASRSFNTLRGRDADMVEESIDLLDQATLSNLKVPTQAGYRDDVKAAEFQKKMAEANARIGEEKNKPNVVVYGTYGLNGRDPQASEAMKEASTSDHPNYTVGIKVDIPLSMGTQSDVRQGYQKEALAANQAYQRKVFEQERQWKDLTNQFKDALGRYQLLHDMEKAQFEKLNYERTRQNRGLTTTFQVLQFEQDFANAQLARLRIQAEVLNIHAQLKTFGGQ